MSSYQSKWLVAAAAATMAICGAAWAQGVTDGALISERVKKLTRGVQWRQVAAIPVKFNTQHPQGMIKIGDTFYVSSVEIKTPTKRYPQLQDGYDRDTGEGAGHLFKFDMSGNLITDLAIGEGVAELFRQRAADDISGAPERRGDGDDAHRRAPGAAVAAQGGTGRTGGRASSKQAAMGRLRVTRNSIAVPERRRSLAEA